jgi:predicted amidohydrolase
MELETLRVAAVQLQSQDNVAQNLADCRRLVSAAGRDGARLVVLPENFAYFGSDETKRSIAESLADGSRPIQSALAEMAQSARVFLVAGGFPERSDDAARPFNTALVSGPTVSRLLRIGRSICSTWRSKTVRSCRSLPERLRARRS